MDNMLNIALPKGRLGERVYDMFEKVGFGCPSIRETNRKLIFENEESQVRYFWVKPSDVAIYVERGAADVGVAGKDILLEYEPDIYELLDLKTGKCRMTNSSSNFLLARHPALSGKMLYERLREQGILVRHFDTPRLCEYNRITVGSEEQMQVLIAAVRDILEAEK